MEDICTYTHTHTLPPPSRFALIPPSSGASLAPHLMFCSAGVRKTLLIHGFWGRIWHFLMDLWDKRQPAGVLHFSSLTFFSLLQPMEEKQRSVSSTQAQQAGLKGPQGPAECRLITWAERGVSWGRLAAGGEARTGQESGRATHSPLTDRPVNKISRLAFYHPFKLTPPEQSHISSLITELHRWDGNFIVAVVDFFFVTLCTLITLNMTVALPWKRV